MTTSTRKDPTALTARGEKTSFLSGLYDSDVYAWAMKNAELIRQGRFEEIDVDNVAEEIESVGKSERRELESRLTVMLVHLLKWRYQPARRGRSWRLTIQEQRLAAARVLRQNPSLRSASDKVLAEAYESARLIAARETDLDEGIFPEACPFSLEQVFAQDHLPD